MTEELKEKNKELSEPKKVLLDPGHFFTPNLLPKIPFCNWIKDVPQNLPR